MLLLLYNYKIGLCIGEKRFDGESYLNQQLNFKKIDALHRTMKYRRHFCNLGLQDLMRSKLTQMNDLNQKNDKLETNIIKQSME